MGDRQQANLRDWAAGLSVSHSCANPRRAGWIGALPVPRRLAPLSAFGFPGQLVAGGDPDGRRTTRRPQLRSCTAYIRHNHNLSASGVGSRVPRIGFAPTVLGSCSDRCDASALCALCGRLRVQETKKKDG